ncbi:c-type cytochrome [Planctomycetales bacterium ZRK34]|nr:c-type cytochrome [Planctomycetales bacterium ZRK34]
MRISVIGLLTLLAAASLLQAEPVPQWIWSQGQPKNQQVVYFRKTFTVDGPIKSAMFAGSCDNAMKVFVNGKQVASSKQWEDITHEDVAKVIQPGENVLAIRGQNQTGIAALLAKLTITLNDGKPQIVVTDSSWQTADKGGKGWNTQQAKVDGWESARVIEKLGGGPWGRAVNANSIDTIIELRKPTATPVDRIKIAEGFKVELLYSVPNDEQGSWVAMCVDPKGRLITSDQYGKLYRVTPPAVGADDAPQIQPLDINVGTAQGLVCVGNSLYIIASQKDQGLYRAQDTNGDGQYDKVDLLRKLSGGGEHGPHAVLLGPDGKSLYIFAGNHTKLTEIDNSLPPRHWDEDHLLPRMWDARGHARGILAPGGWVARTDLEGKTWTLVSNGFRNAYDGAFNAAGDLFTYDSDMEWDMNLPWYRPTRVNHVVEGSEFGWRSGAGKWPPYYADSLPALYDVGPGSPTGLVFGYGSHFPEKYQKAMFICDWSYGKLYAVHLSPDGATYKPDAVEEFASAAPLPLTDIVVNPKDGAMYFLIGGRKVQSGLYRVTYKTPQKVVDPAVQFTDDLHTVRRHLQSYYDRQTPGAIDDIWKYLGHEDRFIRFAARTALEHQPVEKWEDRALAEKDPQAAITALIGLARSGDKSLEPRMLEALGRISFSSLNHQAKLALLRAYELTFIRMGRPDDQAIAKLIGKFDALYPAQTRQLNAELCIIMVYLDAPSAIEKTLKLLAEAPTQEEQLHYAMQLRVVKDGWAMPQRREYFSWFIKAADYRGGASFRGYVDNIRKEAITTLSDSEKKQLGELLEGKGEPAPSIAVEPRQFIKVWTVDELTPYVESHLKGRDFARGRKLYAAASCANCHRFAGEGGAVGPDLTAVGNRFSVRDMLESIIEPSKTISDQYESTIITLVDNNVVMGRIVNLSGDSLRVSVNLLDPNQLVGVDRKKVKSMMPSPVSMMPPGLLMTLTQEEVADLIAYMQSGGNPDAAAFK